LGRVFEDVPAHMRTLLLRNIPAAATADDVRAALGLRGDIDVTIDLRNDAARYVVRTNTLHMCIVVHVLWSSSRANMRASLARCTRNWI
jgi:hypothetical protein